MDTWSPERPSYDEKFRTFSTIPPKKGGKLEGKLIINKSTYLHDEVPVKILRLQGLKNFQFVDARRMVNPNSKRREVPELETLSCPMYLFMWLFSCILYKSHPASCH